MNLQNYHKAFLVMGIDLILGAHSHDFTPEPIWRGRIPIVQGGSNGRYLAEVELEPGSSRLGWTVHNCA